MNVYLITTDNELITPELSGSILEGVTRDSILELAKEFGLTRSSAGSACPNCWTASAAGR